MPSLSKDRPHPRYHDAEGHLPSQRLAIQLLAGGMDVVRVAKYVGTSVQTVRNWRKKGAFAQAVTDACAKHEDAVCDFLINAELRASYRLLELVESQDEEIALKATIAALDRMGTRGRPVERSESKKLILSADVMTELKSALADPGVKARLREIGIGRVELPSYLPPGPSSSGPPPEDSASGE